MSLFGRSWGRDIRGQAKVRGRPVALTTVRQAIDTGLTCVTEDRKALGLILKEPIQRNITMANLSAVATCGLLNEARETQVAEGHRRSLNIRTPSVFQTVMNLPGGNPQKVVLAKWFFAEPDVPLLDKPTRGIDVGAKYEIYGLITALSGHGSPTGGVRPSS